MASFFLLHFLFVASTLQLSVSLILPVTKHAPTNQYLTQVRVGTRPEPVSLLVDLGNPVLWLDCASRPTSQTQTFIQCLSISCSTATSTSDCSANLNATSQSSPPCVLYPTNPISNSTVRGELVEDTVAVGFQYGQSKSITAIVVEDFLFTCAPQSLLQGLAGGARGVFGLGKSSRISPITQIAHKFDLPRKFSLCLSGRDDAGAIFAGKIPDRVSEISRSLVYTPLVGGESWPSNDYSIRVKSVEINGRKLSMPGSPVRARISSVDPFTKMGSGIYRSLVRAFAVTAESLGLTRVEERKTVVGGLDLGLCYYTSQSRGIPVDEVPVIDLVLQSEMVKWRINAHNSMMHVEEKLICLGLVDGGSDLKDDEMVIGAHQLVDNLLEFNLVRGMLGISSSLLAKGTSCSQLSLDAHESL